VPSISLGGWVCCWRWLKGKWYGGDDATRRTSLDLNESPLKRPLLVDVGPSGFLFLEVAITSLRPGVQKAPRRRPAL
jgi:hypothetical protein